MNFGNDICKGAGIAAAQETVGAKIASLFEKQLAFNNIEPSTDTG
jgi:hypothetical protein